MSKTSTAAKNGKPPTQSTMQAKMKPPYYVEVKADNGDEHLVRVTERRGAMDCGIVVASSNEDCLEYHWERLIREVVLMPRSKRKPDSYYRYTMRGGKVREHERPKRGSGNPGVKGGTGKRLTVRINPVVYDYLMNGVATNASRTVNHLVATSPEFAEWVKGN